MASITTTTLQQPMELEGISAIDYAEPPVLVTQEGRRPQWRLISITAASFTVVFTCCGLNFAFGVYQALYETLAHHPGTPFEGASPAEIDLIGTLGVALMTMAAPFAVAWSKLYSPRLVTFFGGFVFGLSLVLASFGTKLWHFELTQGLMLGIGTCMSYMVAVTVAPPWFTTHRGLAMGLITAGTGVGGLVWAPALNASIKAIGFRNTLRLSGGVSFVLVALSSCAMAWEPVTARQIEIQNQTRRSRISGVFNVPLVDLKVARSRKFLAQALAAVCQSAVYYLPVFFFASYAKTLGYSDTAGANFIAVSNACNAIGKIVIGYIADRSGRLNTLFLTTFLSAIFTVSLWLPSALGGSQGLFIAFAVLYGSFASAYIALFPTSLVELFGPQHFASVNGVLYMLRGLSTMVGTPVGGVLTRTSAGEIGSRAYVGMSVLVSVLLFATAGFCLWARVEAACDPSRRGARMWKM